MTDLIVVPQTNVSGAGDCARAAKAAPIADKGHPKTALPHHKLSCITDLLTELPIKITSLEGGRPRRGYVPYHVLGDGFRSAWIVDSYKGMSGLARRCPEVGISPGMQFSPSAKHRPRLLPIQRTPQWPRSTRAVSAQPELVCALVGGIWVARASSMRALLDAYLLLQ
jgi:hypothetical protein